jgi:hypothetical protein
VALGLVDIPVEAEINTATIRQAQVIRVVVLEVAITLVLMVLEAAAASV